MPITLHNEGIDVGHSEDLTSVQHAARALATGVAATRRTDVPANTLARAIATGLAVSCLEPESLAEWDRLLAVANELVDLCAETPALD